MVREQATDTPGLFNKQKKVETDTGECRINDQNKRKSLEFRKPDPMPKHVPASCDYIVDWLYTKTINGLGILRSTYYAMRSLLHNVRWGVVTYETYHQRRIYCLTCEHNYVDYDNCRIYCGFNGTGCGCPKLSDLLVKLRLAGFECPARNFSTGRNIQPLAIHGELKWRKQDGKVVTKATKVTSALQPIGQTDSQAPS